MTGLTFGTIYEFKVEARNQYDYSAFSDALSLLCAYIPEVPTSVTTEIESTSATEMKVSWSLASANGSPITSFRVFVKEIGTETFTEESVDCVGSDASVISNTECSI